MKDDDHILLPTEPSPLDGKRPIASELAEIRRAHNKLTKAFYEHTISADSAYVGGDRRRHHDSHLTADQILFNRQEFWKKIIPQVIGGIVIALVTFVSASILFYVRKG